MNPSQVGDHEVLAPVSTPLTAGVVRPGQGRPAGAARTGESRGHRLGKQLERRLKRVIAATVTRVWPARADRPLPAAAAVRRILLVRVNYRMGNTVLATALLPALRARFPLAEIDVLGTEASVRLWQGLGIRQVQVLPRRYLRTPWRAVELWRDLRRMRYDVAVDGAMGSSSGVLYGWLSGAPCRLGRAGSRLLTTGLALPTGVNVYATAGHVAAALGVSEPVWPQYRVTEAEAGEALASLREFGLAGPAGVRAFVGVFPGGHQEKRWPREHWLAALDILDREGVPTVVLVGPEEVGLVPTLRSERYRHVRVVLPGMRRTAAVLAHARLLLTTDSGPMHLAAALRVPVVIVAETTRSFQFVPPGEENQVLWQASPPEAAQAIRAHPRWRATLPAPPFRERYHGVNALIVN